MRLGVGVFGFEVGGDFRILFVAKPGVVVSEGDAVENCLFVFLAGNWWRESGVLSHVT